MCQKPHWVLYRFYLKHDEGKRGLCISCSQCKGGYSKWVTKEGYVVRRYLRPHKFDVMAKNKRGDIKEHRFVMAQYLGRPLLGIEIVHHRNGIRHDNRIENLELTTAREHTRRGQGNSLRQEILCLKQRVRELEEQLRVVSHS